MRFVRGILQAALFTVLLLGAYGGYRLMFGRPLGESCTDTSDCRQLFNVQCLHEPGGQYCTTRCRSTADCPEGWTCAHALGSGAAAEPTESICARGRHGRHPEHPAQR